MPDLTADLFRTIVEMSHYRRPARSDLPKQFDHAIDDFVVRQADGTELFCVPELLLDISDLGDAYALDGLSVREYPDVARPGFRLWREVDQNDVAGGLIWERVQAWMKSAPGLWALADSQQEQGE
jgi:hypothetical protein